MWKMQVIRVWRLQSKKEPNTVGTFDDMMETWGKQKASISLKPSSCEYLPSLLMECEPPT